MAEDTINFCVTEYAEFTPVLETAQTLVADPNYEGGDREAFQKVLDQSGGYISENAAILVWGRISARDEKEPLIMADSIRPLSDLHELGTDAPPKSERKLWLRLPEAEPRLLRRIELLCEMFPGKERMIMVVGPQQRRLGAECLIADSLVRELKEMLGESNVVVKYTPH